MSDTGYPDLYPGELDAIEREDRGEQLEQKGAAVETRRPPLEGLVLQVVNFEAGYVDGNRRATSDLEEATAITSMVADPTAYPATPRQFTDLHKVVLDLDVPATLVPSSTPGHSHLYIDVTVEWDVYKALLEALQAAGILEDGYVGASLARGFTAARLPWIKKEQTT